MDTAPLLAEPTTPRRVLIVGYPAAELLDIACVVSALQIANHLHGRALYQPRLASPGGNAIHTGTGLVVNAEIALERVRGPIDTLVVSGGIGYVDAMADDHLLAHVGRLGRLSRRVASVCTGAGILAGAGLLDNRRAATHWRHAAYLTRRFTAVTFDPVPIFIRDGDTYTSAGVTSAIDLTLSFIEADAGPALARDVARDLVTYLQRPGNQAQMSVFTTAPAPTHSPVRHVIDHITAHLDADLSTAILAHRAGLSERHLTRMFNDEIGLSPGKFVRRIRAESAATLLVETDLTIAAVARRCGFGTAEALRQSFIATYGVAPSRYRATQQMQRSPA